MPPFRIGHNLVTQPYSLPFQVRQTLRKNLNRVALGPNAKNQSAIPTSHNNAEVQVTASLEVGQVLGPNELYRVGRRAAVPGWLG